MRQVRELWLPFLIVALTGAIVSALLPYFPVDETRYLSVAWEMKLYDSFIVPLKNGLPYSHKPPLLFWLINLDWLIFGVNEWTLRAIPVLFSLANIALVHRIALLLWDDERVARYAALILSSLLSYLLWSTLIMFDVVLTFWVLLAMLGLLSACRSDSLKPWLLIGIAMGGGLLTKGPVVFVYLLPVALFSLPWLPKERRGGAWYARLSLAVAVGVAILLIWLIPAVVTGGASYREEILWGQTVNRVANSFAHKRPFWWYLPLLPALLLPWVLLPATWRSSAALAREPGGRFVLIWGGSALLIFSLISGKQVHYLIPALPAFSLLMARNLASGEAGAKTGHWRYAVGAFYCALAALAFSFPSSGLGPAADSIGLSGLRSLSLGLLAIGILLLSQLKGGSLGLQGTAVSSAALCALVAVTCGPLFQRYELHDISNVIGMKQEQGYSILHQENYHAPYQFLGRLKQPLVLLQDTDEISRYAASHDKVALVTYEPETAVVDQASAYFQQPFRNKKVVLWNRKGIAEFVKGHGR